MKNALLPTVVCTLLALATFTGTLMVLGVDATPAFFFSVGLLAFTLIVTAFAFKWTMHRESQQFLKDVFLPPHFCICIGKCSCRSN